MWNLTMKKKIIREAIWARENVWHHRSFQNAEVRKFNVYRRNRSKHPIGTETKFLWWIFFFFFFLDRAIGNKQRPRTTLSRVAVHHLKYRFVTLSDSKWCILYWTDKRHGWRTTQPRQVQWQIRRSNHTSVESDGKINRNGRKTWEIILTKPTVMEESVSW